jgi:hypothetical protein
MRSRSSRLRTVPLTTHWFNAGYVAGAGLARSGRRPCTGTPSGRRPALARRWRVVLDEFLPLQLGPEIRGDGRFARAILPRPCDGCARPRRGPPSSLGQERDSAHTASGSLGKLRAQSVVNRKWDPSWRWEENRLWTETRYQADRYLARRRRSCFPRGGRQEL